MSKTSGKAVAQHRARQRRKGLVRVEVQVPREDRRALRALSEALRDPERSTELREKLSAIVDEGMERPPLKELLVSGPDTELDLKREKNIPRRTPFD